MLLCALSYRQSLGIDSRDDVLGYAGTLHFCSTQRTVVPRIISCTLHPGSLLQPSYLPSRFGSLDFKIGVSIKCLHLPHSWIILSAPPALALGYLSQLSLSRRKLSKARRLQFPSLIYSTACLFLQPLPASSIHFVRHRCLGPEATVPRLHQLDIATYCSESISR